MQTIKPTSTIEIITPQLAKEYFSLNVERNKKIRPADVNKLKDDILKDRFQLTNDAIGFNKEGRLINGQHRLLACMAANKPITVLVARGLEDSAMEVIDSGCSRTLSDRIRISGVGEGRTAFRSLAIQALITFIYKFVYDGNTCKKISIGEATEIYDRYQASFNEVYSLITKGGNNKNATKTRNMTFAYAALSAMCNSVSLKALLLFVDVVCNNNVEGAMLHGYNYKAALRYSNEYITAKQTHSGNRFPDLEKLAKKSIYCFVNNKQNTKSNDPYPMSIQRLDMLESRLRLWSEQKGA